MAPYALLLGIILALAGCGGGAYYGGYASPYYYGTYPYYYDQLYGPSYIYPYPDIYYYSVPRPVPAPGFRGQHFEPEGHGEFRGGGERGGGGGSRGDGGGSRGGGGHGGHGGRD